MFSIIQDDIMVQHSITRETKNLPTSYPHQGNFQVWDKVDPSDLPQAV